MNNFDVTNINCLQYMPKKIDIEYGKFRSTFEGIFEKELYLKGDRHKNILETIRRTQNHIQSHLCLSSNKDTYNHAR